MQIPQVFDKVVTRLGLNKRDDVSSKNENMLIQVSLNMEKHPPAEMPPVPLGLNPLQVSNRPPTAPGSTRSRLAPARPQPRAQPAPG